VSSGPALHAKRKSSESTQLKRSLRVLSSVTRVAHTIARCSAVASALGLLAFSLSAEATTADLDHPDFRGQGRFDRSMTVAFRIVEGPGRDYVRFDANNVPWTCDDGDEEKLDLNVLRAKFHPDGRRFERVHYSGPAGSSSDEEMYWLRGTISADGQRAKGFFLFWFDPYDPPDGTNLAECSTKGKRRWDAKRIS
jgi:hypothetical protein